MTNLNEQEVDLILRALAIYYNGNKVADIRDRINDLNIKLLNSKIITLDYDISKELHPTEQKYPEQTKRFKEILDEMYQTHLEKNNDYSKYNVTGVGLIGICVRFWDKTCRILNLVGMDIGTGEYTGYKEVMVKDEKIEQTFLDASNYGIIARIYLEGKWGK